MTTKHVMEQDQNLILNTYRRYPIALVKGSGTRVWDVDGKEYLDFLGGLAVLPLGHCHPKVVAAIQKQCATLMHTSNLFHSEPMLEVARCLIEQGDFQKVFFANTGTEANEAAIKLARKYQWRKGEKEKFEIVSATHSFHGRTFASLTATDKPEIKEGFDPLPQGFSYVQWNDIDSLKKSITSKTAAVLLEPVQGEGGLCLATKEFLQTARELCDQHGALLIFDEIQCGLGRLGTFFAYQSFGVRPDAVTLAKGLANGLPIGVLCVADSVSSGLQFGDHGTTFGGNPICAAAASVTLQTILNEGYCEKVMELGSYFRNKLLHLQKEFPNLISEIRGKGLMIGIVLEKNADSILKHCHQNGLLINLTAKNVLRLLPPYIITKDEIDEGLEIIRSALGEPTADPDPLRWD